MTIAGNKVECIDADFGEIDQAELEGMTLPEAGGIYTIREVPQIGKEFGFRFEEIRNGPITDRRSQGFGEEPIFHSRRFRPA